MLHIFAVNAHFFGAKRAYHATLRVARPLLSKLGLTPARFDLLYALFSDHDQRSRSLRQSDLRRQLGVTAATVCRMLQSLERLGLVARSRPESERRQRDVRLTSEGLARMILACTDLIDSELVTVAVDSALGEERWHASFDCHREKEIAEHVFQRLRRAFGDRATLYYPWHPDD